MSNPNTNPTGSSFGGFGNSLGSSQTQNSDKPVFSFGGAGGSTANTGSSAATSGGLFGNKPADSAQPAQSSSLFGNSGAAKPLFGNTTAPSGGLFGSSATQSGTNPPGAGSTSGATTSGGLFGTQASNNKPAFSFGSTAPAPASDKPADKPAFSFGSTAPASDKPADKPAFSFGSTAPASDKPADKPAASGFSFGAPASNAAPTTGFSLGAPADKKPEGGLFGSTSSTDKKDTPAFSFGEKKDDKPATGGFTLGAAADKGPAGGLFGSSAGKSSSTGGFNFGAPADKKPEGGLFGASEKKEEKPAEKPAFSFGEKKEEKPADKPAFSFGEKKEEKPAEKPAFSFGEKKEDKPAEKPAFSFGEKKEEKPADKPGFSFGDKKDDKATTALGAAGSAIDPAKADISPSVYLKNKSFEDIVAKWTSALSKSTTRFKAQAEAIGEWDRVLAENGAKISEVYDEVVAAEQTQTRIDDLLNYLGKQQDDLEAMLDKYERQAAEILPEGSADRLQPVDRERSETYSLAGQVNEKLDSLESQLAQVINEINAVTKDAGQLKEEDPLAQVVQVLNSHVASLDWIDESTTRLQEKLGQAYSQSSRLHF